MTAGSVSSTTALETFAAAVEGFDRSLRAIDDRALDLFWAWETYDEEGVRFGILRTTEQVGDAAVEVAARRAEAGAGPSRAQRILGRYLVAWRELWSVADRADTALDTPPMEGEWPLRTILDHLVDADLGSQSVRLGDPASHADDAFQDVRAGPRCQRSDCPLHGRRVWDEVRHSPGLELSHGQDARCEDVDRASHERLQGLDNLACDWYRIGRRVTRRP